MLSKLKEISLKGKILFVFSDPGGAKPILSLIEEKNIDTCLAVSNRSYSFYGDFKTPVKIIETERPALLPVIQAKKETLSYCINIRTDETKTNWQLEWKNKLALTVPSAVIYKALLNPPDGGTFGSFTPGSSELVGRIEARGDYVFELKTDSAQYKELNLVVYDFIHDTIVDFITLKTLRR